MYLSPFPVISVCFYLWRDFRPLPEAVRKQSTRAKYRKYQTLVSSLGKCSTVSISGKREAECVPCCSLSGLCDLVSAARRAGSSVSDNGSVPAGFDCKKLQMCSGGCGSSHTAACCWWNNVTQRFETPLFFFFVLTAGLHTCCFRTNQVCVSCVNRRKDCTCTETASRTKKRWASTERCVPAQTARVSSVGVTVPEGCGSTLCALIPACCCTALWESEGASSSCVPHWKALLSETVSVFWNVLCWERKGSGFSLVPRAVLGQFARLLQSDDVENIYSFKQYLSEKPSTP